jgi:hypothetical protein
MINYICPNTDMKATSVFANIFTIVATLHLCKISNWVWKFIANYMREQRNLFILRNVFHWLLSGRMSF